MLRKLVVLLIIFSTLSSCKKSEVELLLTNPRKKWIYINSEKLSKDSEIKFYIKFFDNGNYEDRFLINDEKIRLIDGKEGKTYWNYSNDSILKIATNEFKILKIEKDTIHLFEQRNDFKAMLVNVASQ